MNSNEWKYSNAGTKNKRAIRLKRKHQDKEKNHKKFKGYQDESKK